MRRKKNLTQLSRKELLERIEEFLRRINDTKLDEFYADMSDEPFERYKLYLKEPFVMYDYEKAVDL